MQFEPSAKLLRHLELVFHTRVKHAKLLGSGEHNVNYLLECSSRSYVLRIYANSQFDNARKEAAILKRVGGKFGPRLLYADFLSKHFPAKYIVEDYVRGKPIRTPTRSQLVEIAAVLKRLHRMKSPRLVRKPFISQWTKRNVLAGNRVFPLEHRARCRAVYNVFAAEVKRCQPLFKKYKPATLIHDDPIFANMVAHNARITLIDWELANYDYFFKDLGTFIGENHLDKQQEKIFLAAYGFGMGADEARLVKLAVELRLLGTIAWFTERVVAAERGKPLSHWGDVQEYKRELAENLLRLEKLLGIRSQSDKSL